MHSLVSHTEIRLYNAYFNELIVAGFCAVRVLYKILGDRFLWISLVHKSSLLPGGFKIFLNGGERLPFILGSLGFFC
jgi:hypothetical protein